MRTRACFPTFLSFLFCIACSGGTTGTSVVTSSPTEKRVVQGELRDDHSQPVAGADMAVTSEDGEEIFSKTSAVGIFQMEVFDGGFDLSVSSTTGSLRERFSPQLPFPSLLSLSLQFTGDSSGEVLQQLETKATLSAECREAFSFDGRSFVQIADLPTTCSIAIRSLRNRSVASLGEIDIVASCPAGKEEIRTQLDAAGNYSLEFSSYARRGCQNIEIIQFKSLGDALASRFQVIF